MEEEEDADDGSSGGITKPQYTDFLSNLPLYVVIQILGLQEINSHILMTKSPFVPVTTKQ